VLYALGMGQGFRRFTDMRAWQAALDYKRAVYGVCAENPIAGDRELRRQLEESVKGPPAHIAEGFGRFSPPDFARFLVIARSSLMESQNHLIDAVDRGYLSEETAARLNALAEVALEETTGLMEYLQSPEALRNARRARERRIASRPERRAKRAPLEPRTPNVGTPNVGTPNVRTPNAELRTELEHEPSSENRDG
jgi:four helix bundle protein